MNIVLLAEGQAGALGTGVLVHANVEVEEVLDEVADVVGTVVVMNVVGDEVVRPPLVVTELVDAPEDVLDVANMVDAPDTVPTLTATATFGLGVKLTGPYFRKHVPSPSGLPVPASAPL